MARAVSVAVAAQAVVACVLTMVDAGKAIAAGNRLGKDGMLCLLHSHRTGSKGGAGGVGRGQSGPRQYHQVGEEEEEQAAAAPEIGGMKSAQVGDFSASSRLLDQTKTTCKGPGLGGGGDVGGRVSLPQPPGSCPACVRPRSSYAISSSGTGSGSRSNRRG